MNQLNRHSIILSLVLFILSPFSYAEDFTDHDSAPESIPYSNKPAQFVDTPYADEQNVLFEFFLDEPEKIHSALFWLRSYMNTLMAEPYGLAPEFMNVIVLIHGTEIVTLAKKNYPKYQSAVKRMMYYEQLGVQFRVCCDAAKDYNYTAEDFYSFVKIIPSAIVELAHWQNEGYAIIRPLVFEKKFSIDNIR
jgi:intracellular sulfur oxidation DsrE/DsrF family protein